MSKRGLPLQGRTLRDLRTSRGLKQDKAAELLGVSLKTYGNWENAGRELGGRAEPAHIAALALLYEVEQKELIAPGFAPPDPIRTTEEELGALRQQLLDLAGVVGQIAVGVERLLRLAEVGPASRGSRSKTQGNPGDVRAV